MARAGGGGVIVAFHMAGSNAGEYGAIAPRLAKDGFEVIAIDQRSGGTLWGRRNRTAEGAGKAAGYVAALPDLEAALASAKAGANGRPVLAWGSSYSSSLTFVLASRHPELAAVLAFSPGEYLPGVSVKGAAAKVSAPVFVTSAADAGEIAAAKMILAASPAKLKRQYAPKIGVHGSSILRVDKDPKGADAAWGAVEAFLDAAVPARAG